MKDFGFLDEDNNSYIIKVRQNNSSEYVEFEKLSLNAKAKIEQFNGRKIDLQTFIILGVFVKMMNRADSIRCITERGITADAKVLLRGFLEQLIMLKLCCDDAENINIYFKNALLEQNTTIKHLINAKDEYQTRVNFSRIEELQDLHIKAQIIAKDYEIKSIEPPYSLAKKAGLYDLYLRLYRIFSKEMHSAIDTLDGYLITSEEFRLAGISNRKEDDINKIFKLLIELCSKAIFCLDEYLIQDDKKRE